MTNHTASILCILLSFFSTKLSHLKSVGELCFQCVIEHSRTPFWNLKEKQNDIWGTWTRRYSRDVVGCFFLTVRLGFQPACEGLTAEIGTFLKRTNRTVPEFTTTVKKIHSLRYHVLLFENLIEYIMIIFSPAVPPGGSFLPDPPCSFPFLLNFVAFFFLLRHLSM